MELDLRFDKDAGQTLQTQAFEQIRNLILKGFLRPGMILPPTRLLAQQLSISRNTIALAYDRLSAEGYIESRGRAGTFVSQSVPDESLSADAGGETQSGARGVGLPSPLLCFSGHPPVVSRPDAKQPLIDFWVGRSEPSSFPLETWRRLLLRKISVGGSKLTEYGDPAGLSELRVAIANHLARTRGVVVSAEQIIVTSGSQDALNLICRLLDVPNHPFYIENPCYQGAAFLFRSLGANLHPIAVDQQGIVVDKLPRSHAGVAFVTPSHQYPTGATLSLERRLALLEWANETNSVIIEDDYDSHFRYDSRPITALAGLDQDRRVFYLGTFSKSLAAGLRIGFTVVPHHLAQPARIVKSQMNHGQAWLDQAVLTEFIESGLYDRHLRRARKLYKSRRDCLIESLQQVFGNAEISGAEGGLHVVWKLPHGCSDAAVVQQRARLRGVGIYALNSGAAHDFDGSASRQMMVLGYSSVKEKDIVVAVNRLGELLDDMRSEFAPYLVFSRPKSA
ncbi:Transcriptional regulator, GntR family domain [Hyphomicrobium sulfonivorans]|uniref:Transcriptional regulator, GntR family domain n=1 Tax=Hyphomicrobium sulfonivorans TaxID=121290 RepID=A0A109BQA0_HYPSL|nr:PLP-dependent aminotransferase family protein [Hyphomicrobium sulfonivorans]KWT72967.1 Transcriptional regulator, GntR family domain [Hyphomicrobium sulfonivorans]